MFVLLPLLFIIFILASPLSLIHIPELSLDLVPQFIVVVYCLLFSLFHNADHVTQGERCS